MAVVLVKIVVLEQGFTMPIWAEACCRPLQKFLNFCKKWYVSGVGKHYIGPVGQPTGSL